MHVTTLGNITIDASAQASDANSGAVVTDGARVPAGTSWIGVTIRAANGELAPGERRIGELAIASL